MNEKVVAIVSSTDGKVYGLTESGNLAYRCEQSLKWVVRGSSDVIDFSTKSLIVKPLSIKPEPLGRHREIEQKEEYVNELIEDGLIWLKVGCGVITLAGLGFILFSLLK